MSVFADKWEDSDVIFWDQWDSSLHVGLIITTIQSKDMFIFVSGDQENVGELLKKI